MGFTTQAFPGKHLFFCGCLSEKASLHGVCSFSNVNTEGSESLQKTRAGPSHMPYIPIRCVKFRRVFVCEGKRKSFIHTNSQSPPMHTRPSLFRDCHGDVLTAVKWVITPVSQINSNKIQCLPFVKDREKCYQVFLNTFLLHFVQTLLPKLLP